MSNLKAFSSALGGIALLAACSGDPVLDHPEVRDYSLDQAAAEAEGIVLGTTWEALSYPVCMYAWSDPDGDGWGWEFNRSCIMSYSTQAPTYPYCVYAWSDPDGDGWGWEFNRTCIVNRSGSTSGGTSSGGSTSSTCSNPEGTHSVMAALAVAAAQELGRWQPLKDFTVGRIGWNEVLMLSSTGKSLCGACTNIQALLDLQKDEAANNVIFPGNVLLSPAALRSRMVAKYRDQVACEMQPSNGGTTNCPAEQHELIFQRSEQGGCDTNFFFVAKKPDGTALQYPAQLKNKLLFADRENPYVRFQSVGEVVSIDPTYGLNDAGSTSTGSCTSACTKISATDIRGTCCSCNGQTKTYQRSSWSAYTYLCR